MGEPALELLFTSEEVSARIDDLARRIRADYAGKEPVLLGILKGSFLFMADLCRRLPSPLVIDFIRVASYGSETSTSREVRLTKDAEVPLEGRDNSRRLLRMVLHRKISLWMVFR